MQCVYLTQAHAGALEELKRALRTSGPTNDEMLLLLLLRLMLLALHATNQSIIRLTITQRSRSARRSM